MGDCGHDHCGASADGVEYFFRNHVDQRLYDDRPFLGLLAYGVKEVML